MKKLRFELVISWHDFWVGVHVNYESQELYLLPIPMVGVCISWR